MYLQFETHHWLWSEGAQFTIDTIFKRSEGNFFKTTPIFNFYSKFLIGSSGPQALWGFKKKLLFSISIPNFIWHHPQAFWEQTSLGVHNHNDKENPKILNY